MKKIYDDSSIYFKDWTTKKLKSEAKGYDEMINRIECYGTKDVLALEGILAELHKRGVEPITKLEFNL